MTPVPVRPLAASVLARRALAGHRRPRVAGVYDHGVALDTGAPDGLVWCGPRATGLLPSHLVLRDDDVRRLAGTLRVGDAVPVADGGGGDASIVLDGVRTFDVVLDAAGADGPRRAGVARVAAWLRRRSAPAGLGVAPASLLAPGEAHAHAFLRAIGAADPAALRPWIGRGAGSTPAADDMLLGALAWQWGAAGPRAPLATALASLASELDTLTTRTSACHLRWAMAGRSAGHLAALLRALAADAAPRLPHRVQRVARHGATSGIDTLVGLVLAATLDAGGPAR